MKIAPTNKFYNPTQNTPVGIQKQMIGSSIKSTSNNVSFGGAMSFPNWMFKSITNAGFFMQFLIIDTLSMVAPRTWVGLNRDRDKTGKINVQAGLEEFGREALSGPSMNLIPMLMASVAVRKMLPSIKLESSTLEGLNYNLQNVVNSSKNETELAEKSDVIKKLAGQIFDDAFGNEELKSHKDNFIKILEEATQSSPKLALSKKIDKLMKKETDYDKAEEAFDKLVVEMNNKIAKDFAPENPHGINLTKGKITKDGKEIADKMGTSSETFFEDFHNYAKDVVEKFMKRDKSTKIEDFFKNTLTKAKVGRMTLAGLAFFAVGGFLLYLPKVYQRGETSPAQQSAQRAEQEVEGGANESK